jgi:hypothetical protein
MQKPILTDTSVDAKVFELFKNICTKHKYSDKGYIKEDLSNPIYYFEHRKDKESLIRIGYHQSRCGNNDILRFELFTKGKIQHSSKDFIIYTTDDLLCGFNEIYNVV